jgi:hypothetical protein
VNLEDIRKLVESATSGPWVWRKLPNRVNEHAIVSPSALRSVCTRATPEDAAFIVAARDLVPRLLAVAEAAKAWLEEAPRERGDGRDYDVYMELLGTIRTSLNTLEAEG